MMNLMLENERERERLQVNYWKMIYGTILSSLLSREQRCFLLIYRTYQNLYQNLQNLQNLYQNLQNLYQNLQNLLNLYQNVYQNSYQNLYQNLQNLYQNVYQNLFQNLQNTTRLVVQVVVVEQYLLVDIIYQITIQSIGPVYYIKKYSKEEGVYTLWRHTHQQTSVQSRNNKARLVRIVIWKDDDDGYDAVDLG